MVLEFGCGGGGTVVGRQWWLFLEVCSALPFVRHFNWIQLRLGCFSPKLHSFTAQCYVEYELYSTKDKVGRILYQKIRRVCNKLTVSTCNMDNFLPCQLTQIFLLSSMEYYVYPCKYQTRCSQAVLQTPLSLSQGVILFLQIFKLS